jgi:hypothetical protein
LVATDLYVDMAPNEARSTSSLSSGYGRRATQGRGRPGGDLRRPDPLGPARLNTNMAWAFKANLPTPNLDGKLLFPLALSSPIYTLRDLSSLFVGFQRSTAQMFTELIAYDARRLGTRFKVPFFLFQGETDVVTLTTLATEYWKRSRRQPRSWR